MLISLARIAETTNLVGSRLGKTTYGKLHQLILDNPSEQLFEFSVKGIQTTDGTFARETLLLLAKTHRGRKGILLVGIDDRDQLDNWAYAAGVGQPLMAWNGSSFQILGKQPAPSAQLIVDYVFKMGSTTSSNVANALNISVHNASTQMNRLQAQGYLIRTEEIAASGGREFIYHSISPQTSRANAGLSRVAIH